MGVCSRHSAFVLLLSGLISAGCTKSGPPEYRATGAVTFGGQPVPDGWVCFTPNSGQGNVGPQGRARIRAGTYDTNAEGGRGVVGGPVRVRVDCFDGQVTDGLPYGKPMLASYEVAADLPRQEMVHNVDIPKAWADKGVPVLPP